MELNSTYTSASARSKNGDHIQLHGVTTNNLKGIDASFPIGKLTVVTGVSGSGKSSLVFDSLYAESFRRYAESLSSFARQYLQALPKPGIERVHNLPPSIAVKQQRAGTGNARSTVGTMTELNDLLRIIFAQRSQVYCNRCGSLVERDHADRIAAKVMRSSIGQAVLVTAPLSGWHQLTSNDLRFQLETQGFGRLFIDGEIRRLSDVKDQRILDGDAIVDRLVVTQEGARRLAEAARLALQLGNGRMSLVENGEKRTFSSDMVCCGIEYRDPSTSLFSYNHPLGACQTCQGFGYEATLNWEKVIPDRSQSLSTRGVVPWNFGSHDEIYLWAKSSAKRSGVSFTKSFAEYTKDDWEWLQHGDGKDDFSGVEGYFKWLESQKHKAHYRIHAARFRKYVLCSICKGGRLNDLAQACRINGKNLSEVSELPISAVLAWLHGLSQTAAMRQADRTLEGVGFDEALEEAVARSSYLLTIGVGYLSLNRQSKTLSGGEAQRIHMARCLGSALTDTLYCLDEPTCGLHARDSKNLLTLLQQLRDQGNTVVAVEHDRTIIRGADHLIEIGPSAGHLGGTVTASGTAAVIGSTNAIWPRPIGSCSQCDFIQLDSARTHNLKNVSIRVPLGKLTVVCGVSGSGKTSLIQHTFYPLLAKHLHSEEIDFGDVERAGDAQLTVPKRALIGRAILVSQASIGRSSRSNIATYLGIYDAIRKIFAQQPLAVELGLTSSSFSFNTPGGRCENCRGLGVVTEDLSFLGEMDVVCPVCEGRRFDSKVLSVRFRDKDLIGLLRMTLVEARDFFVDYPEVLRGLDGAISLGLGYVTLGQPTSSFSGGEAQRLKLVKLIFQDSHHLRSVLIFDEPSTGLSDKDVFQLLQEFKRLTAVGHTVVVVEHHIGLIQSADWVIEVGPEAADAGGHIIHMGEVEKLLRNEQSVTRPYIAVEMKDEQSRPH